jgi:hypothetical protein
VCHAELLPIWERWTDGQLALRRFLECRDGAAHDELIHALLGVTARLGPRGSELGVYAALQAAGACLKAYVGVPEHVFLLARDRALAAHQAASAHIG